MSKNIVYEGWLTKSPPSKRIWRTKWRRRWFALRQSGELPGQYFLDYYSDRHCRRLKGSIDLDCCDQVDAGLHMERDNNGSLNRKLRGCVFTIQTNIRTYHLEADSEEEMEKWVDAICRVCGLRATDESTNAVGLYQNITLNERENIGTKVINDSNVTGGARKRTHTTTFRNSKPSSTRGKSKVKTNMKQTPIERHDQGTMTVMDEYHSEGTGPYIPISECITGVRTQDTQTAFTFDPKNIVISSNKKVGSTRSYTYLTQPQIRVNNVELSENESNLSEDECRSLSTSQFNMGDWTVAKSFKRLSVHPQSQEGFNADGPPVPPRPPKTFAMSKDLTRAKDSYQGPKFQETVDVHECSSPFPWVRLPRRMSQGAPTSPGRSVISHARTDDEDDVSMGHSLQYCNLSSLPPAVDRALKPRHSTHSMGNITAGQKSAYRASDEIKSETLQYLDLDLPAPSSPSSFKVKSARKTSIVHGKSLSSDECAYKTVDFLKTEAFNITRQDAEASRSVQQ
ncbi:unnamed protein product [Danaus chrysippus]|uniref:(African queen) hypothetical protein n=1 Tax=Danaus chrysippus TaxID=151541 RepID=A0A8J2MWU9_9NEOP|nr:unnamed protein product [Danaus chrysippus]